MAEKKEYSVPKSHPRYESLMLREAISNGVENGLTAPEGLIAHGRGEAFDYLLGECTQPPAENAIKAAAANMILAERPVISVNGNVTALAAENITKLGKAIPAKIEVNIFHYSQDRFFKILRQFQKLGEKNILGEYRDKNIPGLDHVRGQCTNEGIYTADTVLVPLEDGDRAQALRRMGKDVITIDLNPLSRTAKAASITIVDNLVRVIPKLTKAVNNLMILNKTELLKIKNNFDNIKNLKEMLKIINERLTEFDF